MIFKTNQKILAIAPHVDDIECGAGATIHRLAPDNEVHYLGLSWPPNTDEAGMHEEFAVSLRTLGVRRDLAMLHAFDPRDLAASRGKILHEFYRLAKELAPDIVFVPSSTDIHQSHEVVQQEARRAFKHTTILGYELPWNNFTSENTLFVRVSPEDIAAKRAAMAAYRSQAFRPFIGNDIVSDLARVRGVQAGCPLAESFEIVRMVL